jgi:hypothetical protein
MVLIVAGAMCSAAGRAEAGVLAINLQLGGGSYVAVPAPAAQTPVTMMWSNQPAAPLAGYAGTGRYFRIDVPDGQTYLNVVTAGGWGYCDLYLARGYLPTPGASDFAAADPGTEQQVTVLCPAAGTWYVLVHGAQQYGDVSLMGSFWQQANVLYDEPAGALVPLAVGARNVRVCIAWDRLGWRRPEGGLVPFIQRELRERREIRQHIMQPAAVGTWRDGHGDGRVERPAASQIERPVVNRIDRPAVGNVERPAVNRSERPAVSPVERPAVTGRNPLQDRPAALRSERPAASQVQRPAVAAPRPAAPSQAERPVVTHAAAPAPVRTAAPIAHAAPAIVTHVASPAPVATRAQRIEPNSVPAPAPTRARAAAPEPTPVARAAAPAPAATARATAAPAREPAKDRQTAAVRDRQGRDGM